MTDPLADIEAVRRRVEDRFGKGSYELDALDALAERLKRAEAENVKLNRAIVAHHNMDTLSDDVIRRAYGHGAVGKCPVCRGVALAFPDKEL